MAHVPLAALLVIRCGVESLVGLREHLVDVEELAVLIADQDVTAGGREPNERHVLKQGRLDLREKGRGLEVSDAHGDHVLFADGGLKLQGLQRVVLLLLLVIGVDARLT